MSTNDYDDIQDSFEKDDISYDEDITMQYKQGGFIPTSISDNARILCQLTREARNATKIADASKALMEPLRESIIEMLESSDQDVYKTSDGKARVSLSTISKPYIEDDLAFMFFLLDEFLSKIEDDEDKNLVKEILLKYNLNSLYHMRNYLEPKLSSDCELTEEQGVKTFKKTTIRATPR